MCTVLLPPGVNPITANKYINTNIKSKEPAQKQSSFLSGNSSLSRLPEVPFQLMAHFTSELEKKKGLLHKTAKRIMVVPFPHLVSVANIRIRMSFPNVCLVTLIVTTICVLGCSKYSVTPTARHTNHLLLVTYQQVVGTVQFSTIQ